MSLSLEGDCALYYDGPPTTTQPTIEFIPLSSGSKSDIDYELLSTTLTIAIFLGMAFLFTILVVYAAQRLLPGTYVSLLLHTQTSYDILRIMDTLGTSILSIVWRLSLLGGRNVWTVNGRGQAVCPL